MTHPRCCETAAGDNQYFPDMVFSMAGPTPTVRRQTMTETKPKQRAVPARHSKRTSGTAPRHLPTIGVYGYDNVETIILAALVTEDPLLLIGKAGTGKTYLLNSLSEALGLEHRHYNASLISFDDLVGFPYPEPDNRSVRYLETPATVWQAESVLVDEISRCKPEHQNRLFSLVHERRIQGIRIGKLRYRWAAMNPCDVDQGVADSYEGSLPLDQALADRFAFVLEVPDWGELGDDARRRIADPRGEGVISEDTTGLRETVEAGREKYLELLHAPPESAIRYSITAATLLGEGEFRLSPRRVRQLTRNLLAVMALDGGVQREESFRLTLTWSFPHRAWGIRPDPGLVSAAHKAAWDHVFKDGAELWLNELALERRPDRKIRKILAESPDEDTGSLAVNQDLRHLSPARQAAYALALYPATLEGHAPIGREGVAELAEVAEPILEVNAQLRWQERLGGASTDHPELSRLSKVLSQRRGNRLHRARQLFYHILAHDLALDEPDAFEEEFNRCVAACREWLRRRNNGKGSSGKKGKG
jgi:MoxR-like ATPase